MAFTETSANVVTNGRSIVEIKPASGVYTNIGYVAEVKAKAVPQTEETTKGGIPVGWDLAIEGKMKQTRAADWQACMTASSLSPDNFRVVGALDTATLTSPLVTYELDKDFNGKTGSNIMFKATYTGAPIATANTFLTASS